jgi:hypothetical protein
VQVNANIDAEFGDVVIAAMTKATDDIYSPGDGLTAAQRRAEAFVNICRHSLGCDRDGTTRPDVTVIVDYDVLVDRTGRAELADGEPLTGEAARRLACDAGVHRVITRGASQILDYGRTTRTVPAALRRAVVLRDRHCQFAGCNIAAQWCEAHHLQHWAAGGPTDLANLALLCRRHHHLVHEGGYQLQRLPITEDPHEDQGHLLTRKPDGTIIASPRANPCAKPCATGPPGEEHLASAAH